VEIDDDVGIPAGEEPDKGPCFRRLELHEVTIQIEPLRVLACADTANRAVLLRAMVQAESLVAIGVVDRGEEPDCRSTERLQVPKSRAAGEVQYGLLSLDLAGVDVGHHEDHRQRARYGERRLGRGVAHDHERKVPPFLRSSKHLDAHPRRLLAERLDE
jgi:hypothetical protein